MPQAEHHRKAKSGCVARRYVFACAVLRRRANTPCVSRADPMLFPLDVPRGPSDAERLLLVEQGWGVVDGDGMVRDPTTRRRCAWHTAVDAIVKKADAIHPIPAAPDAFTAADGPLFGRRKGRKRTGRNGSKGATK